jgi:2-oxoglutarate ferredoxin oxidoreductase subunit gamma
MSRLEIRVTGLGGQGVVLAGLIIGRACAIHGGRHATMIQSFGPEARGSACSATLAISDSEVLYPYIRSPDVLVAMSSEGYWKYREELKPDGVLLYEKDLVHPEPLPEQRSFGVSSTRIAETLGRTIVQNIVMVGFFTAATGIVTRKQMRDAVLAAVPAGTKELNLEAFDAGWTAFEDAYGEERVEGETAALTGRDVT